MKIACISAASAAILLSLPSGFARSVTISSGNASADRMAVAGWIADAKTDGKAGDDLIFTLHHRGIAQPSTYAGSQPHNSTTSTVSEARANINSTDSDTSTIHGDLYTVILGFVGNSAVGGRGVREDRSTEGTPVLQPGYLPLQSFIIRIPQVAPLQKVSLSTLIPSDLVELPMKFGVTTIGSDEARPTFFIDDSTAFEAIAVQSPTR